MPYLGQSPSKGDENNFKILDDISSYTLTFDGTDASVVSAANDTITSLSHRFVQGQRVTYHNGGGSNIAGLTSGTAYYIIKHDHHNIKLATSASNASNGTAVNITGVAPGGSSHTLNVAFDGVNTKFKATHTNGQKARITRSAQLVISVNGVIQQPHDTATPSTGFGFDLDGTIVLSQAPVAGDVYWAHVLTNNNVTFDISDNDVDNFTGNASTVSFNLSKTPPDNRNVLVTIDGVVQYPNDPDGTVRAYNVVENVLTFTTAPAAGAEIQVRHIGFAGSTSGGGGGVTNFYGRTGSVVLKSTDNITVNDAAITGNATVTGDLTVNGTTTTLDTVLTEVDQLEVAANNSTVGVAITQSGSGDILNLYDGSNKEFSVADGGTVKISQSMAFQQSDRATTAGLLGRGSLLLAGTQQTDFAIRSNPHNSNLILGVGVTERLRITSGGYVGINTNNPLYPLHVKGDTTTTAPNATGILMGLQHEYAAIHLNAADTKGSLIDFSVPGQDRKGGIQYLHSNNPTTANRDAMLFYTNGTNERLRITSTGKVGINSTSPTYALEVDGGTQNTVIAARSSDAKAAISFLDNTTGGYGRATIGGEGTEVYITSGTGGSEKLRITSTGQVQLNGATGKSTSGTSATDLLLANGAAIRFRRANDSNWINTIGVDNSDNLKLGWGGSVDEIHFGIAGIGEPMILDSTGNLGIGTDNPQSLLSLHQSGGGLEINANSGANNARLLSYDRAASAYREMTFQALSYGFEVGGTERFDIDSNGHFTVTNGNAANFNTIQRHSTSLYCGIRIQDADATQRMQFGVAGGLNQIANGAAQHDVVLKSYANLLLATNQTERLRIDSSGRVLIGSTALAGDATLQVFTSDRKHPAIKVNSGNSNGFTMLADAYKADESQVNIGIMYSSAKLVLSTSVKPSDTADNTFLSSQDTFNARPCALTLDHGGVLQFLNTSTNATTTTDSAVSLTERFSITRDGFMLLGTGGSSRPVAGQRFNSGNGWGGVLQIERQNPNGNNNNVPFVAITAYNGANEQYTGGISFNRSNSNTQGTQGAVNTNQQLGNIAFNGSDGTNFIQGAEIFAIPDQTFTTNDGPASLVFATTPDGNSEDEPQERLRINSDGQSIFTANKASGYIARFVQSHADNVGEIEIDSPADNNLRPAAIRLKNAGTDKWAIGQVYQSTSSKAFHICSGSPSQSNSKFVISTAGDVGVGNDSPNCRLAVKDTAEHAAFANATPTVGNSMFQLYNNPPNETANDHATIQFGVNGGSHNRVNTISAVAESAGNRKMAFVFCTDESGSRTEKMRITGDGNLGVGVYSPSRKLDVSGDILGNTFMLRGNTSPSSTIQAQMYRPSDNTLAFATNGNNERMRIDSSGRVVVGGSSTYIGGAALAVLGTGTTPNTYGSFAIGKVGANPTSGTTLANIRLNGGSVGTGRGAEINAVTSGNWSDGSSHPTSLSFAVAKDGSTSATERVLISSYGHFQVTNFNALPSGSTVGGTNGFKGLSQHGYQHWGQRQYYSGQRNLTQNQYFDLFQNNINHDDIIFWLNIKGYHSNRTFATAHGTIGGYGLSVSYQSASGVYGAFSGVDVAGYGGARRKLRWTSTSPNSANWWIWGWFSGTAYTSTLTGWAAGQLH